MTEIIIAADEMTLSECRRIRKEVFILEKGVDPDIEQDEHDIIGGACEHLLIRQDGQGIGALRCMREGDTVRLQRFCVLSEHRGKGAGAAAVAFLEEYYKNRGVRRFLLDAKCSSEGFYARCGYKTVSQPFMEADVLHVKMQKDTEVGT